MQPAHFVEVHAAEFGSPLVESGLTDVVFGANVLDGSLSLSFTQHVDDLFVAELALFHSFCFLFSFTSRTLLFPCPSFGGQASSPKQGSCIVNRNRISVLALYNKTEIEFLWSRIDRHLHLGILQVLH